MSDHILYGDRHVLVQGFITMDGYTAMIGDVDVMVLLRQIMSNVVSGGTVKWTNAIYSSETKISCVEELIVVGDRHEYTVDLSQPEDIALHNPSSPTESWTLRSSNFETIKGRYVAYLLEY